MAWLRQEGKQPVVWGTSGDKKDSEWCNLQGDLGGGPLLSSGLVPPGNEAILPALPDIAKGQSWTNLAGTSQEEDVVAEAFPK